MISLTTRKIFMMNCRITSLKIYKKFFKEIILESFSGKDAKNSSDYRASLLIVCGWLMKKQPDHFVSKILLPHTEIQEILYQTDKDRRTTSILGLHSFCFQHAMLFKINLTRKTNDTDKSEILWILLPFSHQTRTRKMFFIFREIIRH